MSRKKPWSPYAVPGLRNNLLRDYEERVRDGAVDLEEAVEWGSDADTVHELRRALYAAETITEAVREADLFWVSSDMAAQALDASQDIPGFTEPDLTWPFGMMMFETPLPGLSGSLVAPGIDGEPIDGLLWRPTATGLWISWLSKGERFPEEFVAPHAALGVGGSIDLPLSTGFHLDLPATLDEQEQELIANNVALSAFLAAAWHLMAMPTVARTRDVRPRTGESRPAESVTVPAGQVRVVDARPMKSVPTDPDAPGDGAGGRRYSTRWVVRGHWRQQAHGTGRAQRRTQWIESYIKGPEGAPLAPHTLVRAWRR